MFVGASWVQKRTFVCMKHVDGIIVEELHVIVVKDVDNLSPNEDMSFRVDIGKILVL